MQPHLLSALLALTACADPDEPLCTPYEPAGDPTEDRASCLPMADVYGGATCAWSCDDPLTCASATEGEPTVWCDQCISIYDWLRRCDHAVWTHDEDGVIHAWLE